MRVYMDPARLIYDWNTAAGEVRPAHLPVELADETLRDGLQSPSVVSPSIEQKLELLHLMDDLKIDIADIGLPGAGPHVAVQVERLAREIVDAKMSIRAYCAARTVAADIVPIVEISQRVGMAIEIATFIGSSPIRQYAESWELSKMVRLTREAVELGVKNGCPVNYVTEDTTRAHPDDLEALYGAAIQAGASRVCVCDTVGHATPEGVESLIGFIARFVAKENPAVKIDWHGHQDRGLSVPNSLAALRAGAHRVHACGLGIGERVGNTPMDQLLVNLQLLGWIDRDLTKLSEYVSKVSKYTKVPIPDSYPVLGRDAFRTGTGVHAAAIIKARSKGHEWLADRVYSGVPAAMVGLHQVIEVGPMSGESNVAFWLEEHGHEPTPERVKAVFRAAKESDHVLSEKEILAVLAALGDGSRKPEAVHV
jgi:isopropylmalate/homocitrate/citramalate synthase